MGGSHPLALDAGRGSEIRVFVEFEVRTMRLHCSDVLRDTLRLQADIDICSSRAFALSAKVIGNH
jgi:hypothetical protein